MQFADLVNEPPLSTAIDEAIDRRPLASEESLAVEPTEGDRELRRRAVHHLLTWWLYDRVQGHPTFETEGGIAHVAESEGEAASHAEAVRSGRDDYLDGEPLDRDAATVAVDCARFDLAAAGSDPPYETPAEYGAYDEGVIEELVALTDLFEGEPDLQGPGAVFEDHFGLTADLGVDPPILNVVVSSREYGAGDVAYTPVLGPEPGIAERRWRELVGWVLLDDFLSRVEFYGHPPEEELAAIEGIEYGDPAEQGDVSLATLPLAIVRVVRQVTSNRESLGLTAAPHRELGTVGVYHAHRGDLRTVDAESVRGAGGYPALFETFVEELLSAADHDGVRRIADHFLDGDYAGEG